jgi:hypothetical protein
LLEGQKHQSDCAESEQHDERFTAGMRRDVGGVVDDVQVGRPYAPTV